MPPKYWHKKGLTTEVGRPKGLASRAKGPHLIVKQDRRVAGGL